MNRSSHTGGERQALCIGIDLGGTKIRAGVVDHEGRILVRDHQDTRAADGPDAVIRRMVEAARRLMAAGSLQPSDLVGVGVGAPGPVDLRAGLVLATPNLPGWDRVPLQALIEDALGVMTVLNNDANAAALGEYLFGAGRGTRNMVYCTASTGAPELGSRARPAPPLGAGSSSRAGCTAAPSAPPPRSAT